MAISPHPARNAPALQRHAAAAEADPPGDWQQFDPPAEHEQVVLRRIGRKPISAWRPLAWFWLLLLTGAAGGGGVLQYLGPPAGRSAREQSPAEGQRLAGPVEAKPPVAASPPPRPSSGAGAPPEARAADDAARARADAAPRGRRLVVYHPVAAYNSGTAAQRLAAQIGLTADEVTTEPVVEPPQRATIRFYSPEDHAAARRLGRELGQLGYPWQIENLTARSWSYGQRTLEVWLPDR